MVFIAGHRALRTGRHSEPGGAYLITFTTHARHQLFVDFALACAVARTFEPSASAASATLLCWVLMPDHFHALIRLEGNDSLSQAVHRIKSCSTRASTRHSEHRRIWARAFHDHAIRRDEDILHAARYVVMNPVRAGIVGRVAQYPFWNAVWLNPAQAT